MVRQGTKLMAVYVGSMRIGHLLLAEDGNLQRGLEGMLRQYGYTPYRVGSKLYGLPKSVLPENWQGGILPVEVDSLDFHQVGDRF
jgi:hypothetical protein